MQKMRSRSMKKMNASLVMFVIVAITYTYTSSSVSCATTTTNDDINDDDVEKKIAMVVNDDQTVLPTIKITMEANNMNALQLGRLMLRGARASVGDFCHVGADCSFWSGGPCCEGLKCDKNNQCQKIPKCLPLGSQCALIAPPCCWPSRCSGTTRGSTCIKRRA